MMKKKTIKQSKASTLPCVVKQNKRYEGRDGTEVRLQYISYLCSTHTLSLCPLNPSDPS